MLCPKDSFWPATPLTRTKKTALGGRSCVYLAHQLAGVFNPAMSLKQSAAVLFQMNLIGRWSLVVAERRDVRVHARICEGSDRKQSEGDNSDHFFHLGSPRFQVKSLHNRVHLCVFVRVGGDTRSDLKPRVVDIAFLECEILTFWRDVLRGRDRL